MAALAITAAQVLYASGPVQADAFAGEAFVAGSAVYLSDVGQWLKAKCGGTTLEAGVNQLGIALATADAVGARVSVALPGSTVNLGAAAAAPAGTPYFLGAAAGAIVPLADLVSTNKVVPIALGTGGNKVVVTRVYDAGSVKP
jgi:hypothetical protein